MYRVFIDEVGHHNLNSADDPNERYLGLMGIIASIEYADTAMTAMLDSVKNDVFGTQSVVLHRREIINKKPAPFDRLANSDVRALFDRRILEIFEQAEYVALTILIDKREHVERYRVWQSQPYHYCLIAILERYVSWLEGVNQIGDVLVESRGKSENKKLSAAYARLYKFGTANVPAEKFQRYLSSKEIKLKPKSDNIAGLQIADLLANPACRDLICRKTSQKMKAEFGNRVIEILRNSKYRRSPWDGHIEGWGTKTLP